jgi:hypothetical protein
LKESTDALTAAASTVAESKRLVVAGEMGGADDVAIVMTSKAPVAVGGDDKKRAKVNSRSRTQQFVEMQDSELCSLIDSLITGTKT